MIRIYYYDSLTQAYIAISKGGTYDNPLNFPNDPAEKSVLIKQLFIRNDESTKYYTDVSCYWGPSLLTVSSPTGYVFKILSQDGEPSEAEWAAVSSGNTVEIGDIGSADAADMDFHSMWVRVEVPYSTTEGVYKDVSLYSSYETEGNVV